MGNINICELFVNDICDIFNTNFEMVSVNKVPYERLPR